MDVTVLVPNPESDKASCPPPLNQHAAKSVNAAIDTVGPTCLIWKY
jgi:hypothetical protein